MAQKDRNKIIELKKKLTEIKMKLDAVKKKAAKEWQEVLDFISTNGRLPEASSPNTTEVELAHRIAKINKKRLKLDELVRKGNEAAINVDIKLKNQLNQIKKTLKASSQNNKKEKSSNTNSTQAVKELSFIADDYLSAFNPDTNFIEDKNGEITLTEKQLDCLKRIKYLEEYLAKVRKEFDAGDTERKRDIEILEMDILTQKNLFQTDFAILFKETNDKVKLYYVNWVDPDKPNAKADYFDTFNVKQYPDEVPGRNDFIPSFMVFGYDVPEDFVPNLKDDSNAKLWKTVKATLAYNVGCMAFFVNQQKLYVLDYNYHGNEKIPEAMFQNMHLIEELTFEDEFDSLDFIVEYLYQTSSHGSGDLRFFYQELAKKFKKKDEEED